MHSVNLPTNLKLGLVFYRIKLGYPFYGIKVESFIDVSGIFFNSQICKYMC